MKRTVALISLLFYTSAHAYTATVRCNSHPQAADPIPGMMWQTFMNVLMNGFIATQSPKNSPEQQQAVINALSTLSVFGKEFLKSVQHMNDEELSAHLERCIKNPTFIAHCMKSCRTMRLTTMSAA